MEKWKIVDNYHEIILENEFETESEAENFVKKLIAAHKERKESYDYDVVKISSRMRYYDLDN